MMADFKYPYILKDHLGVPIEEGDELVTVAWWPGRLPKYLAGQAAVLVGTTARGSARVDIGGRIFSVPPSVLGVVNRATGHGWEGNRSK